MSNKHKAGVKWTSMTVNGRSKQSGDSYSICYGLGEATCASQQENEAITKLTICGGHGLLLRAADAGFDGPYGQGQASGLVAVAHWGSQSAPH